MLLHSSLSVFFAYSFWEAENPLETQNLNADLLMYLILGWAHLFGPEDVSAV